MARVNTEMSRREGEVTQQLAALEEAKRSIDQQVAEKVRSERAAIAADEARKAKAASATELESKTQELTDLKEVLAQRDEKLAAAQKQQAELLRKQRELDDAKRELDL